MPLAPFIIRLFLLSLVAQCTGVANSQNYPTRPIRIVTTPAGGGSDFASRLIAHGVSPSLGQQIIIDNRPLVSQGEIMMKALPDGYTLLVASSGFWIYPLIRKAVYDPVKDFAPITLATKAPYMLVVHPSLPIKSVKELIALAKAKPGELNYSIGGRGGSGHLAGELFKSMAGIDILAVPYSSGSQEIADLVAGRVQLTVGTAPSLMELVKLGKLRVLGVTSAERSALYPEVPTVAASGVPGYEAVSRTVVFVPAKTPVAIVKRLNQELVHFLKTAPAIEQFLKTGTETVGSTPQELAAVMTSEMITLGKVIKDAGIREQ